MRRDDDEDEDERDDEDEDERPSRSRRTPTGQVYVHKRCGGATKVSGGDFSHICDPFWPCTETYCCGCSGFVSLDEVRWADTDEKVSKYRTRMVSKTPPVIKVWRYGVGLIFGLAIGLALGFVAALIAEANQNRMVGFLITGGIVGALAIYLIGAAILSAVMGVDYRRFK